MNKEELIKKLTGVNIRDYSYAIIFFITFSFFILAVIRPNITTVFNLQKELKELEIIKKSYDGVIGEIINIQTAIENTRDTIYVIDEAMPVTPQLNELISNIRQTATESNINIDKLTVSEINLKQAAKRKLANQIQVKFETFSSFEDLNKFILSLHDQRRLKTINEINIIREDAKGATDSGKLNIKLVIDGYYL